MEPAKRLDGAKTSHERFMGRSTIYGADGEHWTPYMTRWWFGRLRLHIFYRGDADPDCHDHPWDFWTFPLTPYVEEVVLPAGGLLRADGTWEGHRTLIKQVVPAFWLTHRPATHTHRVLGRLDSRGFPTLLELMTGDEPEPKVRPGNIITLVWRSGSKRPWGFLKNRDGRWCWVAWKEYVYGGGKHAACEPGDSHAEADH